MNKIKEYYDNFMDIHKVVTIYLWPFVYVGIVILALIIYDLLFV
jgi:hypothetical protein